MWCVFHNQRVKLEKKRKSFNYGALAAEIKVELAPI